jgi:hypothetical protein
LVVGGEWSLLELIISGLRSLYTRILIPNKTLPLIIVKAKITNRDFMSIERIENY